MTWNLPKIREACLELLGWRRETSQNFLDGKTDIIWTHTDGRERYEGLPHPDPLPDPTESLDDALPLMEKYQMNLLTPRRRDFGPSDRWAAGGQESLPNVHNPPEYVYADTAPLAVCLCALRCTGRDLKEFEV